MDEIVAQLRAGGSVFAEDEARILRSSAATPAQLTSMVGERVRGVPLEHVVGWVAWCGLRVDVGPGVFVPRQRTEILARAAGSLVEPGDVVVDLCCGSGAVGAFLVSAVPEIELFAVDLDPVAVECARRNLPPDVRVLQGDLFAPLPESGRGRVDVLVANAPYVPTEEIRLLPPEARIFEPGLALDGGPDGLDVLRRLIAGATEWLTPGGHVLVESSLWQARDLAMVMKQQQLDDRTVIDAELGTAVFVGTKSS